jgi:hypothetical protein
MAGYHSILAKAVSALEPNTAAARGRLYQRARSAMSSEIEKATPQIDGADVAAAKIAFESAVMRVEADCGCRSSAIEPELRSWSDAGGRGAGRRTDIPWLTDLLERASDEADDVQSFGPRRARGADVYRMAGALARRMHR